MLIFTIQHANIAEEQRQEFAVLAYCVMKNLFPVSSFAYVQVY